MEYQPDFKTFKKIIKKEKSYIIYTTLVADLDTPVSAMLRIGGNEPYSFLLESVEGGEAKGRYSILGLQPDLIWRCYGNNAEVNYDPANSLNKFKTENHKTLDSLLKADFKGIPLKDKLTEQTGIIGEKIELKEFKRIDNNYVGFYIHAGNKIASLVSLSEKIEKSEELSKNILEEHEH